MDFKTYAMSKQIEICLELERVRLLLEKAGNPDKGLRITHVAGTNGKGSVCSFICQGLEHMGRIAGKFSSPELFDVTDTITVNSVCITQSELDNIYTTLAPVCDLIHKETGKSPSQFEINFVAAMLHFKNKGCTDAVLECGMGGLGDATNAIGDSHLCVITQISLDHQSFLGDTVEEIAANKCGIFKDSSAVVTGFQTDEVMKVIESHVGTRKLIRAFELTKTGNNGIYETVFSKDIGKVRLSLAGVHQVKNASIAAEALRYLGADCKDIRYALQSARNPARFEEIETGLYFDGAHNPDGADSFVRTVNRLKYDGKAIFVVGFMKDKDYTAALSALKKLDNPCFEVFTVTVHTNPRTETAANLQKAAQSLGYTATAFDDISSAISRAKELSDNVFAFGSLYMYKEYVKR